MQTYCPAGGAKCQLNTGNPSFLCQTPVPAPYVPAPTPAASAFCPASLTSQTTVQTIRPGAFMYENIMCRFGTAPTIKSICMQSNAFVDIYTTDFLDNNFPPEVYSETGSQTNTRTFQAANVVAASRGTDAFIEVYCRPAAGVSNCAITLTTDMQCPLPSNFIPRISGSPSSFSFTSMIAIFASTIAKLPYLLLN